MDMCSVLSASEALSWTQALSLWVGCRFGVSEPVAALAGLTAAFIGVGVVAIAGAAVVERWVLHPQR